MCSHIKCARIVFQSTPLHGTSNTCQLSDGITLLDAQGGALASVSTEKKSAQIGHRITDNRRQFGVRTWVKGRPGDFSHRASNLIYRSQYCFALFMLTGKFI